MFRHCAIAMGSVRLIAIMLFMTLLSVLLLGTINLAGAACPLDMLAYWEFDDGSGPTAIDSFDGHDGTLTGSPVWSTGTVGGALQFNGTDQYMQVPDDAAFDWASDASFSIELWCKFPSSPAGDKVMIGRDLGTGGELWWVGAQGGTAKAHWNMLDTGGNGIELTGTTTIEDDVWHHIVAVRDESADLNLLYVDSDLEDSGSYDYLAGFAATTTLDVAFLNDDETPDLFYGGLLDEIAIYDRALTPGEIQMHYDNGLAGSGYCPSSPQEPELLDGLSATQVLSGSPAGATGSTTAIQLTWTAPAELDAATIEIYRKGFGFYPEYDDGGGAEPALPASPGSDGWVLAASVSASEIEYHDTPATRDFWYYCAYVTNWYGQISVVSARTNSVLDYFLGDVSDGVMPPGEGNNGVWTDDISLLGDCYGTDDMDGAYDNVADVGPTDGMSVLDRPLTDNLIDFEDLIIFAVNYGIGQAPPKTTPDDAWSPLVAAARNSLILRAPPLPDSGQTFAVELAMTADGQVQGLSIPLQWNDAVVEYVDVQPGALLAAQGRASTVMSPEPGTIDVALLGVRSQGLSGEGNLAVATFRVIGSGEAEFGLGEVSARDAANRDVTISAAVMASAPDPGEIPRHTRLRVNAPNPFNPRTTIGFDLAQAGRATLKVYGVDGRLVTTLVDDHFLPGHYSQVWDGTDGSGKSVASGTYLYRLQAPELTQTRIMQLIR